MALKVVSMEELRLQVLLEPERTGESVSEVCARRGISRASFYRYRRRFLTEGAEGLEPRTRRPRSSPARITASLEVEICTLRCRHPRWGARRIRAELRRAGLDAPAISTVHQTLRRNNLVAPQPRRRQRADKRFERETSNDLWQIDATQVVLRGGEEAWSSTAWTTTPASAFMRSPARAPRGRPPGPASALRPPPTGCRASSSPTTT